MNREIEIKIPLTQSEYESLFSKIHEQPFTKPEHLYKKSSAINTTAQHTHATGKSPAPKNERIIPMTNAMIPAIGDWVA